MPVIDLNLAMTYCPTWKLWEGVRELVQNAVDGDESGYPMKIEYLPKTSRLVITNTGIQLPAAALTMGYSFKGAHARGKHGEGLKVGLLALVRAGHDVTIYNGQESWRPEILERGDVKVLSVRTRALTNARNDLRIEIEGVAPNWWQSAERLFLFLKPPATADTVKVGENLVLLHPDYAGHVFSRGIFVTRISQMMFGYEVPGLQLDRDRGMIESWDFRSRMSDLWEEACKTQPGPVVARLYDAMAAGDNEELRALSTYRVTMPTAARELKFEMRRRKGDLAVAVSNANAGLDAQKAGLIPVTLPIGFVSLLETTGESVEMLKLEQRSKVVARVDLTTFTADEHERLLQLGRFVDLQSAAVVHFTDPEVRARSEGDDQLLLDRTLLSLPIREAVSAAVSAEVVRTGRTPQDIYLSALFPTP